MQQTLEQAFHVDGDTTFDVQFWNRFVLELAARFRGLEGIKISWDEISRQAIDVALDRINLVIGPAAERVQRLTSLGFLVASSETPATLGVGAILQLTVTAGDTRDLFTPSPFLILARSLTPDDYAVARLRTYDRETGLLEVEIVTFAGDPGPHGDWTIGALAGSTLAQLLLLDQARDLFADTVLARNAAAASAGLADQDRIDAQAARVGAGEDRAATAQLKADTAAIRDDAEAKRAAAAASATAAAQSAASVNPATLNAADAANAAAILLAEQRARFFR